MTPPSTGPMPGPMRTLSLVLALLFTACGGAPAARTETAETTALLTVGARAPDFALRDQSGALRTMSEHRGRAVVLYFYPRDATPGCTREACALRDAWDRLQAAGAVVYGVSTDDVASHQRFAEEHELPFSLLADTEQVAVGRYGVPTRGDVAARVTFIVGTDGRVARVFPDVDPAVHADEVLAALADIPSPSPLRARIEAVVAASDRSEADRALDAGRRPVELLSFFGIAEGMRVVELFAGGGYTAELLARTVGPEGRVYGQNSRLMLERFAEAPWSARLALPTTANVTRVDRELDSPIPDDARELDAVLFILAYHDSVWMRTDRAAMNRAIFEALRPGGVYGVVDHVAAPGRGLEDVQTLHRIERDVLVREIEQAGFVLEEEALFLANPDDPRDWSTSPSTAGERRGTSDRVVLRFVRPAR